MQIRDRVRELRRVRAAELRPNSRNWRVHPQRQQEALRGVLAEIGYADALLVRETEDGQLELIDGHLRAETTPDQLVPVLVLDVTADEAIKILATHDPLTSLADTNANKLDELLRDVHFDNDSVNAMLLELTDVANGAKESPDDDATPRDAELIEAYQVVIECESESEQRAVFERMRSEGYKCRVLTL